MMYGYKTNYELEEERKDSIVDKCVWLISALAIGICTYCCWQVFKAVWWDILLIIASIGLYWWYLKPMWDNYILRVKRCSWTPKSEMDRINNVMTNQWKPRIPPSVNHRSRYGGKKRSGRNWRKGRR